MKIVPIERYHVKKELCHYGKNDDTICLARSIVTAYANLKSERWTKSQLQDGFNKSRKLQRDQAMKLHEDAIIEINDYGDNFCLSFKFFFILNLKLYINLL